MRYWPGAAVAVFLLAHGTRTDARTTRHSVTHSVLDRVTAAVDGAESSHGADLAMWRPDPSGPEGPMQVSAAAATDVGGGDRFDNAQNRAIGRAYLSQLHHRYGSWPEAIAAYNWGIGNVNAWIAAGRPIDKLAKGVLAYLGRVLHDSGLCTDTARAVASGWRLGEPLSATTIEVAADRRHRVGLGPAACTEFAGRSAGQTGKRRPVLVGLVSDRFHRELEAVVQQTSHDLSLVERR